MKVLRIGRLGWGGEVERVSFALVHAWYPQDSLLALFSYVHCRGLQGEEQIFLRLFAGGGGFGSLDLLVVCVCPNVV